MNSLSKPWDVSSSFTTTSWPQVLHRQSLSYQPSSSSSSNCYNVTLSIILQNLNVIEHYDWHNLLIINFEYTMKTTCLLINYHICPLVILNNYMLLIGICLQTIWSQTSKYTFAGEHIHWANRRWVNQPNQMSFSACHAACLSYQKICSRKQVCICIFSSICCLMYCWRF